MKELEFLQEFPHYKSMGIFFRRSSAAYSQVLGRIWHKFDLVRDVSVLHTSKNEGDPVKNECARVLTRLNVVVSFLRSRAANSEVSNLSIKNIYPKLHENLPLP